MYRKYYCGSLNLPTHNIAISLLNAFKQITATSFSRTTRLQVRCWRLAFLYRVLRMMCLHSQKSTQRWQKSFDQRQGLLCMFVLNLDISATSTDVERVRTALGHDKAQNLIDEITKMYERGGPPPQAMPSMSFPSSRYQRSAAGDISLLTIYHSRTSNRDGRPASWLWRSATRFWRATTRLRWST